MHQRKFVAEDDDHDGGANDEEPLLPPSDRRGNDDATTACPPFLGPLRSVFPSARRRRRISSYLGRFWYEDMPPLHGPLRIVFYTTLLFLVVRVYHGSGVRGLLPYKCRRYVAQFRHYDGLGFNVKRGVGLAGVVLSVSGLDAPEKYVNCDLLATSLRWGLALSGLGIGGRFPRYVAAICWWTMFAIKFSTFGAGVGHELYLPGVALAALCFAEDNFVDGWSVDAQLAKMLRGPGGGGSSAAALLSSFLPPPPAAGAFPPRRDGGADGPSPGRASRKIVLIQAAFVMFFAGVHKFATYGPRWLDGGTIFQAISRQEGRSPALREIFLRHSRFFAPLMGTASVAGELLAIAAIFSRRWRHVVVGSWVGFHVGIMLLMHPNFSLNMCTYILIIDWRAAICGAVSMLRRMDTQSSSSSHVPASSPQTMQDASPETANPATTSSTEDEPLKISSSSDDEAPKDKDDDDDDRQELPRNLRVGVFLYTVAALAMFFASLLRIDRFPFNSYVLYNYHPRDPGVKRMYTSAEAVHAARKCVRQPPLNPACDDLGSQNHHGMFSHGSQYTEVVLVTALDESADLSEDELDKMKNSKSYCHPDELRVYRDWEPHSCWPRVPQGVDAASISEHVRNVLRAPLDGKKSGGRRRRQPKDLPDYFWDTDVEDGLEWRMRDAVAASIDEGPRCFAPLPQGGGVNWKARPSPASPASRLARRMRSRLSVPGGSPYVRDAETAVGLGIFFEFVDGDVAMDGAAWGEKDSDMGEDDDSSDDNSSDDDDDDSSDDDDEDSSDSDSDDDDDDDDSSSDDDEERDRRRRARYCKMGESYVGDEYLTAKRSEEGIYNFHLMGQQRRGEDGRRLPERRGDWSDVSRGVVLVAMILFVTYKLSVKPSSSKRRSEYGLD